MQSDVFFNKKWFAKQINLLYTSINAHIEINQDCKTSPEKANKSWKTSENSISEIPLNHATVILINVFNAQLDLT